MPQYTPSSTSSTVDVKQSLAQLQGVQNLTANGSAFIDCVDVNNHTEQFGQNNVAIL
jgi:Leu/Phe-tRNA-protein transferase